ncbi:hypothetical protein GLOTRDRAFT_140473 [Gloeophyllum trabeum ATCC 11539]|uniref:HNH nuclease domain-containing protein n=1 Tax=Gloeophyllum trabeum (strain ATCC 11539 / FP-39264 / Madison 617) TaxID=670483 RepID=S7RHF2_GLOTA|nr:uncharacterized protein GLOTRDRAFT_140473 [Gloeophyllum trabeum ATCC 11539]EPQ51994.1 hypothetical protein GLOTRDRAFT_140473 [Gloeophyllum trabeum ATCC 11539]
MLLEPGPVPLSDDFVHPSPTATHAYSYCRQIEQEILQEQAQAPGNSSLAITLMNIRIAGHLIDVLAQQHEDYALARVVADIVAGERTKRIEIGEYYNQYFIKSFRGNRGRTPSPSKHPSRPPFDFRQEVIKRELESRQEEFTYPKNHHTAKKWALVRDNYRCVLTKNVELYSDASKADKSLKPVKTQCAHIFPESTNRDFSDNEKLEYASRVWAVLERFGYPSIKDQLLGDRIHLLDNVLTLDPTMHSEFDALQIWFEATDVPNQYEVVSPQEELLRLLPNEVVTFESTNERLALPNPTYLRIHALCCRVAHLAGAAEYYNKLENDDEYCETGPVPADALAARLYDLAFHREGLLHSPFL